mgnify:CR=1 FL=1|tara:strand:- start:72 stop:983 length:912 start_codon:yes stop_codon:yes gene_type:complete
MKEQITRPMLLTFIVILIVTIGNWVYVDRLEKNFEEQLGIKEERVKVLDKRIHTMDSTYKSILDSLPIGLPMDTLTIRDGFGLRRHPLTNLWHIHSGVDMISSWRDTVYCTGSGSITYSGWNLGYGKQIRISHMLGLVTTYSHLYKTFVNEGDNVVKGQVIGIMGSTGRVTGAHLHYEVIQDGKCIDPEPFLNCKPINVEATMYHPVEAQCDSDPLVTADGSIIDPYKVSSWNWIAVSQDMLIKNGGILNYGDKVLVKGTKHKDGIYYVHDCMNRRFTTKIDFLENINTKPYRYDNVDLYVLN